MNLLFVGGACAYLLWLSSIAPGKIFLKEENSSENKTSRYSISSTADSGGNSALIYLPTDSRWTIGKDDLSLIRSKGVTIKPAWLGTIEALEISVPPDQTSFSFTIEIPKEKSAISRDDHSQRDKVSQSLKNLFLNGHDLDVFPRQSRSRAIVNRSALAPGDIRISYDEGDELLRLPRNLLPPGANSIRFIHADCTLPIVESTSEDILFFAPRNRTLTDKTDSVFAQLLPAEPSENVGVVPAFTTLVPLGSEVATERSRRYDLPLEYSRSSILPLGNRFVFWFLKSGQVRETVLPFDDLLSTFQVNLSIQLLGQSSLLATNPDHYADIKLSGFSLPTITWDGFIQQTSSHTINLPDQPSLAGITLQHVIPVGSPFDGNVDAQCLDIVDLEWVGFPRVNDAGKIDWQIPSSSTPRRVTIGGFPAGTGASEIMVLRVENCGDFSGGKYQIERLSGVPVFADQSGGVAIEFEVSSSGGRYFAQLLSSVREPLLVTSAEQLPIPPVDEILESIFVRAPEFESTLQPLADLREGSVLGLDPQAAYNAFNGGQESPKAIADALAYLFEASPSRVPFPSILLVGHGSLDPKDYLGLLVGQQIHPFVEESVEFDGLNLENCVDFGYGTIIGSDDFEDARVGRLPVRTKAELSIIVDRLVAYHENLPDLQSRPRRGIFVTDNDIEFQEGIPLMAGAWRSTGLPTEEINIADGSNGLPERAQLQALLSQSPQSSPFVIYTGHGNVNRWASENILNSTFVGDLNTDGHWPLIMTFSCLNAYYAFPGATTLSLNEALMLSPTGGAIATIAPTSIDFYSSQRLLSFRGLDYLINQPEEATVGDLLLTARTQFSLDFPTLRKTGRNYLLFGDPDTPLMTGTTNSSADWWLD